MISLQLALAISATAAPPPDWKQSPLAFGTKANVVLAEQAARRCGMQHIHQTHYKDGKAMLWMKPGNVEKALACMEKWLVEHESSFEPLLGDE